MVDQLMTTNSEPLDNPEFPPREPLIRRTASIVEADIGNIPLTLLYGNDNKLRAGCGFPWHLRTVFGRWGPARGVHSIVASKL